MVLQYGTRQRLPLLRTVVRVVLVVILSAACYALLAPGSRLDLWLLPLQRVWMCIVAAGVGIVVLAGVLAIKERLS